MKTMKVAGDRFTVQDYAELPEGFPAQLIDGFLVKEEPLYGHQQIVMRVLTTLARAIDPRYVLPSPVGVSIDEYNVFHPDVAVYSQIPPFHERRTLVPVVVFEVLSPSTRRRDRGYKCRRYLEVGVGEVWLVDSAERVIEIHTRSGARVARGAEVAASEIVSGFTLIPQELPA